MAAKRAAVTTHAGDRMRERRIELGLTQLELGKMLRVGQETVSQWESSGPATLKTVIKVARCLKCEPAWLAFAVGKRERTS